MEEFPHEMEELSREVEEFPHEMEEFRPRIRRSSPAAGFSSFLEIKARSKGEGFQ
ncbi:hypothetical protein [Bhargavaea cecembensis]|uniref:hypothetical protein n=1 Tax=Bhargavaea cecembensis TaxID=394098 RepID=UPI0015CF1B90|nr:hypothetical protein [Bhargavaea cecembensis]